VTPVLILGAGCVGFALGWFARRQRLSLLAENNHWVGEEIEALKGADLAADVAEHRRRHSGEHPPVDDPEEMPRHLWPAQFIGLVTPGPGPIPMTGERDTDAQDRELTEIYGQPEHLGQACEYLACGRPATEWVTWDTGLREFLCTPHHDLVMGGEDPRCPTCKGSGMVPETGNGSDGYYRCPDCPPPLPDLDASDVRSLPTRRVSD